MSTLGLWMACWKMRDILVFDWHYTFLLIYVRRFWKISFPVIGFGILFFCSREIFRWIRKIISFHNFRSFRLSFSFSIIISSPSMRLSILHIQFERHKILSIFTSKEHFLYFREFKLLDNILTFLAPHFKIKFNSPIQNFCNNTPKKIPNFLMQFLNRTVTPIQLPFPTLIQSNKNIPNFPD